MFGAARRNSKGWDLSNPYVLDELNAGMNEVRQAGSWMAAPSFLKNVKKRLELLYPNQHKLNIKESDTFYNVELELVL